MMCVISLWKCCGGVLDGLSAGFRLSFGFDGERLQFGLDSLRVDYILLSLFVADTVLLLMMYLIGVELVEGELFEGSIHLL